MKGKLKNGFQRVKKWVGRHKALVAILVVVCLIGGCALRLQQAGKEMEEALNQMAIETGEVTYRDITSTINATGYVQSDNTRALTTTLMNLEVTDVNVEVGDTVNEGDVLCAFDTEDIEKNLADARESLNVSQAQSGLTVQGAERNLNDAVGSRDYQVSNAQKDLDYSKMTYDEAVADYNDAVNELEDKKGEESDARHRRDEKKDEMDHTADELEESAKRYAELQKELTEGLENGSVSSGNLGDDAGELAKAYNDMTAKQSAAQAAASDYASASAEYEQAKAAREAQEATIDAKKSAMDSTFHSYDKTASSYNNTVRMQDSAVAGMQDALNNSRLSASISSQNQENQVETYEKQLEKGQLTAPISGTVTAVNVKEGDTYTGGVIVTIQDCEAFIVEAEIDEYDISDIKEGMKVLFKTDATREEELEGEVVFVSPVPTSTAASSQAAMASAAAAGNDVTYKIKVAINSDTDRLRLGMTAKMNIILNQVEHVLTVPYDAVQTDETGNTFVNVLEKSVNTEGETISNERPVPVTVGTEGDYYVEVIGEGLTEGMEVAIPKEEALDFMGMMMGQ